MVGTFILPVQIYNYIKAFQYYHIQLISLHAPISTYLVLTTLWGIYTTCI